MDLSLPIIRTGPKEQRLFVVFGLLLVAFNVTMSWVPFFWDNVLNCKIATWYYEQASFELFVPEHWDAGHPPFFNLYLAGIWKIFGKNLFISHLAMLPFVLGTLWQVLRLCQRFLPQHLHTVALLFCVLEPTWLAQNSLISPDLVLVFAYLWGLNSILNSQRLQLLFAMLIMAAVSFRGILMLPALTFSELLLLNAEGKMQPWLRLKDLFSFKKGMPKVWPYAVAAITVLLWLFLHKQAVGWLFTPPAETYGGHREMVGLGGMARNAVILGWRILDFGRVFLWIFGIVAFVWFWRRGKRFSVRFRQVALFWLIFTLLLALFFIPFSNPIGHRYFMVSYLLMAILLAFLIGEIAIRRIQRLVVFSLLLALIGGHFWIYPKRIAQGWDASLAHLHWHGQQQALRAYIKEDGLDAEVCASFPALAEHRYLDPGIVELQNWPELQDKDEADSQCSYILYTPYSNGFSDEEIAKLENLEPLFTVESGGIVSYLYQNASP